MKGKRYSEEQIIRVESVLAEVFRVSGVLQSGSGRFPKPVHEHLEEIGNPHTG